MRDLIIERLDGAGRVRRPGRRGVPVTAGAPRGTVNTQEGTMTDTLTSIFARVGADDSFDLVVGRSVTNPAIGRVFWDDQGPGNRGLVLRLDDAECDELPDDIDELSRMLARAGYRLDAQSVEELRAFVAERQ